MRQLLIYFYDAVYRENMVLPNIDVLFLTLIAIAAVVV